MAIQKTSVKLVNNCKKDDLTPETEVKNMDLAEPNLTISSDSTSCLGFP